MSLQISPSAKNLRRKIENIAQNLWKNYVNIDKIPAKAACALYALQDPDNDGTNPIVNVKYKRKYDVTTVYMQAASKLT